MIQQEEKLFTLKNSIKDKLNYIAIVLLIIVNIIFSLFNVTSDASLKELPDTAFAWVFWVLTILLPPTVGVFILQAFRNEGIKEGEKNIKETKNRYLELTIIDKKNNQLSKNAYITKRMAKDIISKYSIAIIISLIITETIISVNINSLVNIIVNIILFIIFGILEMIKSEDYVSNELILWYKKEISRLEKIIEENKNDDKN
jgi:hypothetical protein